MAVSQEQKVDFLLKKLGFTKTKTGLAVDSSLTGTKKAGFAEAIPSPLVVPNDSLWIEAGSIPATPPSSDTNQVRVYLASGSGLRMTVDTTVAGNRAFIAFETYNDTTSNRLNNWIDTQFGASYLIKVFRGDPNSGGVQLSAAGSGANDGWFFDYSAGILNFNDTNVPSGVATDNIYIVGYRYIGQTGAPTPGISTFSFKDLSIERNLDVGIQGGISTFRNNIDLNGDLDVDGHTNLDNVSIAGVSTFHDNVTFHGQTSGRDATWDHSQNSLEFADQARATFGDNRDLLIYHDGNNSFIQDSGTGDLRIRGVDVVIENSIGNITYAVFNRYSTPTVDLYANNSIKLSTTDAGINVVGTTTTGQLAVTGVSTFTGAIDANSDLDVDGHTNLDNVSIAGVTSVASLTSGRVVLAGTNGKLEDSNNLTFNGSTLAVTGGASFSGNVSIGGTLTYEDVKNVDSVGLGTFREGIFIPDNKKLQLGNAAGSADLEIYHDTGSSHIKDTGTGELILNSNELRIKNAADNETMARFIQDGAVELYHDNIKRLETSSVGVSIPQDLDVDGHTNLDNVSIAGVTTTAGLLDINAGGQANSFKVEDLTSGRVVTVGTGGELQDSNNLTFDGTNLFVSGINVTQPGSGTTITIGADIVTRNLKATGITTLVTTDINGDLDVDGHTNLDNVSVAGVTTFAGNIDANGDLDVDGHTNLDNVSVVGVTTFSNTVHVGTGVTFETNGQGTFSGIVTSRGYEVSYADAGPTHNLFKAGRIRIFDNGSHCHFRFGNHPSYAPHQSYSSSQVQRTNAFTLQNTAATRTALSWVNSDGPVNLWYTKGYAPDYSIKLSTTPIGVTVGSGVTIETNGQASFVGVVTFSGDIDVDGHTNLDNVSIAGVTTAAGHVLPSADSTYDLGSSSKYWRNIYADNITGGGGGVTLGDDIITRNLQVNGISTHVGIATFNDATFHGDLDVDGHTNLDNISVAGVTTFAGVAEFDNKAKFDSTIAVHDGTTGSNGQYLLSTGVGVTWGSFPTMRTSQTFTASAGQTTFSFTYNVGFLDVYVNGVKLSSSEFTANNGTSVVLAVGSFVGDIVELISFFTTSYAAGTSGLGNIVEDTTPQLGGNLDLFNKSITGTGNINITGIITATTFVGDGSGLTGVIGSGSGVVIKDSGSTVGTAGTINFGNNLSVSAISGGSVTITATGGGGGINTIGGVVNIVNDLDVSGSSSFTGITSIKNTAHFSYDSNADTQKKFWFWGNGTDRYVVFRRENINSPALNWSNNSRLTFGSNQHTDLIHSGSGFTWRQFTSANDNPLEIHSDFTSIKGSPTSSHSTRDIADFNYNDGCSLYFTGTKRLQTSGVGVTITSQLDVTNINASGVTTTTEVRSNALSLKNAAGSATYATFSNGGSALLKHNNTDRLETSASGVTVTGTVAATAFSGDGSGLTGITGSGSGVVVKDNGSTVGTAGTINFGETIDVSAISGGSVTVGVSTSQFNVDKLNVSGISTFVGVTTFKDDIFLPDGKSIGLGNGSGIFSQIPGLDIMHSTDGYISNAGGVLNITNATHDIRCYANSNFSVFTNDSEQAILATKNGSVALYHDGGNKKIETSATGVTVTGTVTATAFVGDGSNLTGISGGGGTNVGITTNLSGSFTANAGSPSTINTYGYSSNDRVVEYTILIEQGANFQSQKVLAMRSGTTVHSTQFAVMFSSSLLVQCDVIISGGNMLLRATPETGISGSTAYKIKREVM